MRTFLCHPFSLHISPSRVIRRGDFFRPGLAHHREDSVSQGRVKIGGKKKDKTTGTCVNNVKAWWKRMSGGDRAA